MNCPKCSEKTTVKDSRLLLRNDELWKRNRQCLGCDHRFTTVEMVLPSTPTLVDPNGQTSVIDIAALADIGRRVSEEVAHVLRWALTDRPAGIGGLGVPRPSLRKERHEA